MLENKPPSSALEVQQQHQQRVPIVGLHDDPGPKLKKKSKRSSRSHLVSKPLGLDESQSPNPKKKKKDKEKKKKKRVSNLESSSSLLGGDDKGYAFTNLIDDFPQTSASYRQLEQIPLHEESQQQTIDYEESLKNMGRAVVTSHLVTERTNETWKRTPTQHQRGSGDDLSDGDEGDDIEWGAAEFTGPSSPIVPSKRKVKSSVRQSQSQTADNFLFSSSVAVSMNNRRRVVSHSPKAEKQSILDELASFAEASIGTSVDGTSDLLSVAGSIGTSSTAEIVSHELLVSYMVSTGTPRDVAERFAFAFVSQQTMKRSQSRASSSREIPKTFSARIKGDDRTTSSSSKLDMIRGVAAERRASASSMLSIRDDISIASAASRRPRNYVRANEPGAVEMDGRAFGAPFRVPSQRSVFSEGAIMPDQGDTPNIVVEALPVELDQEISVAYADSSPLPVKVMFSKGPIRRVVVVGMLLLAAAIGIICYFLLSGQGSPPTIEPSTASTTPPSSSPTFITSSILDSAIVVSGEDALKDPNSPQYRAVAWLSTFDQVDHEGYDTPFIQRYVLVTFFFATRGENWLQTEKWLSPTLHECEWSTGISCFTDITKNLVVNGIDLTRNGLTGFLPDEIGLLNELTFLRIPKNTVAGTMPQALCQLFKLSSLNLGSNEINGFLPSDLGNVTELDTLDVSGNKLTGSLPSSLWDLPLLRILDLSSNQLTGKISDRVNQLGTLVSLNLRSNLFTGNFPREVYGMQKLDFLFLDDNKLTGSIPSLEAGFVKAQEISFSNNRFTGSLPEMNISSILEVTSTVRLSRLDISQNLLTGTINSGIAFLPTLRVFNASNNMFVHELPTEGWTSIQVLAAANNMLTGTISTIWPQELRHFDMSGNMLNGTLSTDLCKLANLEFLLLSRNALEGTIPSCIANLDRLRAMEIASARLNGPIPDGIDQLRDLSLLDLSNNTLTGALPSSIGRLTKLNQLVLNDNVLSSSIPSDLGKLSYLRALHLSNNAFAGSIPSTFGFLSNLESITLAGNALSGLVPDGLCHIDTLTMTAEAVGCDVDCTCCSDESVCGQRSD